jgi:general secretion pathway protein G
MNSHFGFRISDFGLRNSNMRSSGLSQWRQPQSAMRNPQSAMRNAFTLIELLLVLVILATLAAIVVPRLAGKGQQAKIGAAQADIAQLGLSLSNFEVDCSRFPTTEEGLNALMTQPSGLSGWKGPYLEKGVPNDPWGKPYQYKYPATHGNVSYDLYSFGPDMADGGGDDIDNWTIKGATP